MHGTDLASIDVSSIIYLQVVCHVPKAQIPHPFGLEMAKQQSSIVGTQEVSHDWDGLRGGVRNICCDLHQGDSYPDFWAINNMSFGIAGFGGFWGTSRYIIKYIYIYTYIVYIIYYLYYIYLAHRDSFVASHAIFKEDCHCNGILASSVQMFWWM